MAQRRRFSAEYTREAVTILEPPDVSVSQIAPKLGIEATPIILDSNRGRQFTSRNTNGSWRRSR